MSRFNPSQGEGQGIKQRASQTVQSHPDEAVLVAFAAGAVVGLIIGTMLGSPDEHTTRRARRAAEGLGERLMASIEKMIPNTLSSMGLK